MDVGIGEIGDKPVGNGALRRECSFRSIADEQIGYISGSREFSYRESDIATLYGAYLKTILLCVFDVVFKLYLGNV